MYNLKFFVGYINLIFLKKGGGIEKYHEPFMCMSYLFHGLRSGSSFSNTSCTLLD